MKQNDIIDMAIQAGISKEDARQKLWWLEAFAKLVDDKTRRELREEIVYTWVPPHFVDLAVEHEREECAKVCEDRAKDFHALFRKYKHEEDAGANMGAAQCMDLIRARGNK